MKKFYLVIFLIAILNNHVLNSEELKIEDENDNTDYIIDEDSLEQTDIKKPVVEDKADIGEFFTVDLSELETEIIPTDKLEDGRVKKNDGINLILINTKLPRISTQLAMSSVYKTNIFSPKWFTLVQDRSKSDFLSVKIDGHNNFNKDLVNNIRNENKEAFIIPVISCEYNFKYLSEQTAFFNEKSIEKLALDIEKRVNFYKLDGFYFDCLDLQVNTDFEEVFISLISSIGQKLKKVNKKFLITIHPYSERILHFMSKDNFNKLSKDIDYFIINTVDYHTYAKKPVNYYNAPFFWINQSVNYYTNDSDNNDSSKSKIIIKVPFYGITYQLQEGERARINPITSGTFMSICVKGKQSNNLSHKWDTYGKEHLIHVVNSIGDMYVSYPTRKFFKERVDYVNNLKLAGIAVDEITQGFEDFMDNL